MADRDGDRMGRKTVSVGSTEVAVDAGGTSTRVTLPADPVRIAAATCGG